MHVLCLFILSSSPFCFAFSPHETLIRSGSFYHLCIFIISSFQVHWFIFAYHFASKIWLCPFLRGCSKIMCSLCLMRWQVSHQWFSLLENCVHLQSINLTVSCLVEDRWWEVFADSNKIWRTWLYSTDQIISQRCRIKLIRT